MDKVWEGTTFGTGKDSKLNSKSIRSLLEVIDSKGKYFCICHSTTLLVALQISYRLEQLVINFL